MAFAGVAVPCEVSNLAGKYYEIRMNKIRNTKLFFACALFWALIFFVDELPSSNQFSNWLEFTLAALIFPVIPATFLA
jgi:hypothetical protein